MSSISWSMKATNRAPTRASWSWKRKKPWSKSPAPTPARSSSSRQEGRYGQGGADPAHLEARRRKRAGDSRADGRRRTATAAAPWPSPRSRTAGSCRPARPCGGWPANWASICVAFTAAGPRGRITVEDVQAAAALGASAGPAALRRRRPPTPSPAAVVSAGRAGPRRLGAGPPRAHAAHPPHHRRADGPLGQHHPARDQLRRRRHHRLEKLRAGVPAGHLGQNIRLTLMPFVMKAVALALRRHPHAQRQPRPGERGDRLQAVREPGRGGGYAAGTGRAGGAQGRSADASANWPRRWPRRPSGPARRQFAVDELRGGTFTISNLGAVGGTLLHAHHQSSGGGDPAVGPRPLAAGGPRRDTTIETRLMLPLEPFLRPSPGGRRHGRPLPQRGDRLPPIAGKTAAVRKKGLGIRRGWQAAFDPSSFVLSPCFPLIPNSLIPNP